MDITLRSNRTKCVTKHKRVVSVGFVWLGCVAERCTRLFGVLFLSFFVVVRRGGGRRGVFSTPAGFVYHVRQKMTLCRASAFLWRAAAFGDATAIVQFHF